MPEWTPQPGELVEVDGLWMYVDPNFFVEGIDEPGFKPLLPACNSMAEAWEALKGMPGIDVLPTNIILELESCCITLRMLDGHPIEITQLGWHNYDYPARGRDWQKEGALREWLAGVASREADHA